jgi:hypothetical protein
MIPVISEAIRDQRTLRFLYKNQWRHVEPHTYGRNSKGEDCVCAWQIVGASGDGYRLFLIQQMSALSQEDSFSGPRPGYHRGDQRFVQIYAEL